MQDENDSAKLREKAPSLLDGYISERDLARELAESLRTWQRRRALRKAPPHCILGKKVLYRVSAVREWLVKQERSFDSDGRPIGKRGGR